MPTIPDNILIQRAIDTHKGRYTYGPFVKNPKHPGRLFTVICPTHGAFTQPTADHLKGRGCKGCGVERRASGSRVTLEEVRTKVLQYSYGTEYEYVSVNHIEGSLSTVTYICPTHGEVTQLVNNHVRGSGCKHCAREVRGQKSRLTLEEVEKRVASYAWQYKYLGLDHQNPTSATVTYICSAHGEVTQNLRSHLLGRGCGACLEEKRVKDSRMTVEEVKTAAEAYGRNYDYVRVDYSGPKPLIVYTCKEHGEITQSLHNHLAGRGCRKCRKGPASRVEARMREKDEALLSRSGAYQAVRVERGVRGPRIVAVCPVHGEFSHAASALLNGSRGCPTCGREAGGLKRRNTFTTLVEKARQVHGQAYEYVETVHDGEAWLHIVCQKHGGFLQRASSHLGGHGCVKCKEDATVLRFTKSYEERVLDCRKVHGDTYEYLEISKAANERPKFSIVCKKHGQFWQDASNHLQGSGCPSCGNLISKPHREVSEFLTSLGVEHLMEHTIPGTRLRMDIYVPEKQLGIEMNGIFFHSDDYKDKDEHASRQRLAASHGIRIMHVFDDEWKNKKSIIEGALKNALGVSKSRKISARKCSTGIVSTQVARVFLEKNHIQGFAAATSFYGLYDNRELVAVGGFAMRERGRGAKSSTTHAELVRYCTSESVRGGLSKVIKTAQAELEFKTLTTFSDIRFFGGGSYAASGFQVEGEIPPDYFYSKWGKRVHKSTLQKSRVKAMADKGLALYDSSYTELALSRLNGYSRVWDCGKTRWVRHWP